MNKSTGNMYDWLNATWNPLNGECPHKCSYCMAQHTPAGRMGFYRGQLRINENQMRKNLGKGKRIFVCSLNDLFARGVSDVFKGTILNHCGKFPFNEYILQTKNPAGYRDWMRFIGNMKVLLGTTIETNDAMLTGIRSSTPIPSNRAESMRNMSVSGFKTFITVEPIMDFEPVTFLSMLIHAKPSFVNIGADSKRKHLPEPSKEKVVALIAGLRAAGIEVREKDNLSRITG